MRLLDTATCRFVWIEDPHTVRYAILSHAWSPEGEQSFQELQRIIVAWDATKAMEQEQAGRFTSQKPLTLESFTRHQNVDLAPKPPIIDGETNLPQAVSAKIRHCCAYALKDGYQYLWIDSCCIDKSSSAELTEAINSMYKWYQLASVCYIFLPDVSSDVDPLTDARELVRSRWFTRGWTLQELIAPGVALFLSKDWHPLGTKDTLSMIIEYVTGIERDVLIHRKSLDAVSVVRRLSWASARMTSREEDEAYSLLGIFGVNMPIVYGEGHHAFVRLQEEILKLYPDQSLFVWGRCCLAPPLQSLEGFQHVYAVPRNDGQDPMPFEQAHLFALRPAAFRHSGGVRPLSRIVLGRLLRRTIPATRYTATCYGYRMTLPVIPLARGDEPETTFLAVLACANERGELLALTLSLKVGTPDEYHVGCGTLLLQYAHFTVRQSDDRIVYLPEPWLEANRERVRMGKLYIAYHAPSHQSFSAPLEPDKLSHYSGTIPFKIFVPEWCWVRLVECGYTVEGATVPDTEVVCGDTNDPPALIYAFTLRSDSESITIQAGVCPCPNEGRLRIRVERVLLGAEMSIPPEQPPDSTSSWVDDAVLVLSSTCDLYRRFRETEATIAFFKRPVEVEGPTPPGVDRLVRYELPPVYHSRRAADIYCKTHDAVHRAHVRQRVPAPLRHDSDGPDDSDDSDADSDVDAFLAVLHEPHHPDHVASWAIAEDGSWAAKVFYADEARDRVLARPAVRLTLRPWVVEVGQKAGSREMESRSITYCLDIALVDVHLGEEGAQDPGAMV